MISEYEKYYFTIHPKAKKKPIDNPYHPSINQWMILQRQAMNSLKQKFKDFMIWFVKYNKYEKLNIQECDMTFITYFKTRIRHDSDNFVPKFYLDGLVDGGFIVDDDSNHIKSLTLKCFNDKFYPRTEILASNIVTGG